MVLYTTWGTTCAQFIMYTKVKLMQSNSHAVNDECSVFIQTVSEGFNCRIILEGDVEIYCFISTDVSFVLSRGPET